MPTEVIHLEQKVVYGPAMAALNPRQRAFVVAHNNAGGKNASESGRAAGYADTQNLRMTVYGLLHNPAVQAAMLEDLRSRFTGDAAEARERLLDMMREPGAHQLNAAKAVLHHAGMVEVTKVQHEGNVTITLDQKLDRYKALLAQTGAAPDPSLAPLLESDATELQPEDPEFW